MLNTTTVQELYIKLLIDHWMKNITQKKININNKLKHILEERINNLEFGKPKCSDKPFKVCTKLLVEC